MRYWHRIVNGVWKWTGMRAWHRLVNRQVRRPHGDILVYKSVYIEHDRGEK